MSIVQGYVMLMLFFSYSLFTYDKIDDYGWSKTYKRIFSSREMQRNGRLHSIKFCYDDIDEFTQLLLGWNASTEIKGLLLMSGRIRNASTKQWGEWHKMFEWGNASKQSFFNRNSDSVFNYAHLDMHKGFTADGFEIKIEATHKKDLSFVKALCCSVSHMEIFVPEKINKSQSFHSVMVHDVPCISQMELAHPRAKTLCSPTALSMLVSFFKNNDQVNVMNVAHNVYDPSLNIYGNWSLNTAHVFSACQDRVISYPARLQSFKSLHESLCNNIPVAVSIRGSLPGADRSYDNGHFMLVVGFDNEKNEVLCNDPAMNEVDTVFKSYKLADFVKSWERSRRLAYKVEYLA